jgi:hypothetical protein
LLDIDTVEASENVELAVGLSPFLLVFLDFLLALDDRHPFPLPLLMIQVGTEDGAVDEDGFVEGCSDTDGELLTDGALEGIELTDG